MDASLRRSLSGRSRRGIARNSQLDRKSPPHRPPTPRSTSHSLDCMPRMAARRPAAPIAGPTSPVASQTRNHSSAVDDAVTASEASTFADQEEACAHQVTQDLLTSELAAAQAGENRELAQEAKLLGLLSGARSWFELAAPELDTSTVIPDWLKTADTPPAGHAVALAVQLAQTDELPEEASPDLQARREWANRNAQSWAQSIETIPTFLPPLTRQIGSPRRTRARVLENTGIREARVPRRVRRRSRSRD